MKVRSATSNGALRRPPPGCRPPRRVARRSQDVARPRLVHREGAFGQALLRAVVGEPRVGSRDRVGQEVPRRGELVGGRCAQVVHARLLQPEGDRVAVRVVDAHLVAVAAIGEDRVRVGPRVGRVDAAHHVGAPSDPARVDRVRRRVALARVVEGTVAGAEPAPQVRQVRQVVVVQRTEQPGRDHPGQHVDHREHDVEVARRVLQARDRLVDPREALDLDVHVVGRVGLIEAGEHAGREVVLPLVDAERGAAFDREAARELETRIDRQGPEGDAFGRGAGRYRAAAATGRRGSHRAEWRPRPTPPDARTRAARSARS